MTLTPDRLDELDFDIPDEASYSDGMLIDPATITGTLVLRTEAPQPTFTMADWREAMDEMETSYTKYAAERTPMEQALAAIEAQLALEMQREAHHQAARERDRYLHYTATPFARDYPGSYCYCSPGRGAFFSRYQEAEFHAYQPPGVYADSQPGPQLAEGELVMTYNRWEPEPEPVKSKELVSLREVIPAPEPAPQRKSWVPRLSMVGVVLIAATAFVVDILAALQLG